MIKTAMIEVLYNVAKYKYIKTFENSPKTAKV